MLQTSLMELEISFRKILIPTQIGNVTITICMAILHKKWVLRLPKETKINVFGADRRKKIEKNTVVRNENICQIVDILGV